MGGSCKPKDWNYGILTLTNILLKGVICHVCGL